MLKRLLGRPTALFNENPYGYLLSTAWRYAEGMRGKYLLIYLMFGMTNLLASAQPIIWGYFINYLQLSEGDLLGATYYYGGAYLALVLAGWAFQWPARLMERGMAFDLSRNLLLETYGKVVDLPVDWHQRHHSGDTINRARKAYEALKNFFDNGFIYFQTLLRMGIALIAICWFSPLFGAVAAAIGLLMIIVVLAFDAPIIRANQETNERENELQASLADYLGSILTVATLRMGKRTGQIVAERVASIWRPFRANTQLNEKKWFWTSVLNASMHVVIVVGYVYFNYIPGELFLVGGLVTLIGYVQQFSNMFNGLTGQYNQVIRFRADLSAIDPVTEAHAGRAIPHPALPAEAREWGSLAVDRLSFSYPTERGQTAGVSGIALRMERGQRVALIGPSGSGKTTVLYTLRGLYPADRIEVKVDGNARPVGELYGQTTLIPQRPDVFEATLGDNVTMGVARAPEAVARALEASVLEPVIQDTDHGLHTYLSEGGANLSGGQRQRISIARGLLAADASTTLLLLDEPTSSLDPATEVEIYRRIFAAYPEKTIVSTLHRLHLLRYFDYVYYLEDGRLLEEGKLDDLLALRGKTWALWEKQR